MTGAGNLPRIARIWICVICAICGLAFAQKPLDPAAWGGNHAGKPVPNFVHGDECLFCHRYDIGPGWVKNAHQRTVRQREDAPELAALLRNQPFAGEVEFFLGSRHRVRFLKKAGFNKFAILSTRAVLGPDGKAQRWEGTEKPEWDTVRFSERCAGCHTSGVDPATKTFDVFGLDCYTCHGDVDLNHTAETSNILLSKKRRSDANAITSLCAQCHLRGGKSRSSGLPYPNNFVAGDNLFQDFQVDFSKADDGTLNPGDRHVWRNVREVAVNGSAGPTCLSCHQVHANSSSKHRFVLRAEICWDCHARGGPFKPVKAYEVQSAVCEY